MSWLDDIRFLVFSGGGARGGFVYSGCLSVLERFWTEKGGFDGIEGVAGTSIGSLYALMIVMGMTANEIKDYTCASKTDDILNKVDLLGITTNCGLVSNEVLKEKGRKLFDHRRLPSDITFKQLYRLTRRHLIIPVCNVNQNQMLYCSHVTTPEYSVLDMMIASMSIPILFTPTIVNGQYLVDGGLIDSCSFSLFENSKTLILRVEGESNRNIDNWKDYFSQCFYIANNKYENYVIQSLPTEVQEHICTVNTGDIQFSQFSFSEKEKQTLIELGVMKICAFIEQHKPVLAIEQKETFSNGGSGSGSGSGVISNINSNSSSSSSDYQKLYGLIGLLFKIRSTIDNIEEKAPPLEALQKASD